MKYKIIPKEYIKICIDRLTRFKPVYERYERVFCDILNKFLISDLKNEFNKEALNDIDKLCVMVSEIFNASVPFEYDPYISDVIFEEENKAFNLENNEIKFLKTKLNFTGAIKYLSDEKLPLNLEWLKVKEINREKENHALREQNCCLFPVKKVILTEGATEEILLSKFALKLGYDFNKEGVFVLGAGGKNQVARKYYKMVDEIKLPVFILLDCDAGETRDLILTKLRPQDRVYLIKAGEFEDILSLELIIKSINANFSNNLHCCKNDFDLNLKMTKNLHNLFKNKGFGEYKKAEFAKMVKSYLDNTHETDFSSEISSEIVKIIDEIKKI